MSKNRVEFISIREKLILKKFVLLLSCFLFFTQASAKIVFEDAIGRKIELQKPAQKVAIVYNFVEYAAVAGEECYGRVVGIGKKAWFGWRKGIWDEYVKACPEIKQIKDIGLLRFGDFYLEKFISLQPDVLILPKWQYMSVGESLKKRFQKANITLIVTDYANQSLDTHVKSTLAIGHTIGKLKRAKQIVTYYKNKFQEIEDLVRNVKNKPKVYVEKGQKGSSIIDDSWSQVVWGKMIDTAGGINIADGAIPSGKHGRLSEEKILIANPDYIFIAGSNWVNSDVAVLMGYPTSKKITNQRLLTYASRKGWKNITAIKTRRLYAVHHGMARSLIDFVAIQYIAKQLYPERFKDVDPEMELRKFHKRFLPVEYKGTWFLKADFE